MKIYKYVLLGLGLVFSTNSFAQKSIAIKSINKNWVTAGSTVQFIDNAIHLEMNGKENGLLWLKDINFENGIIELDIKGNDKRSNSFVGVAFHGLDNTNFEAVYFRPFNFLVPTRKNHSVQYVNKPNDSWHFLRNNFLGKYENTITPIPDPNDWFHAKIVISYPEIKVYVNDSKVASLNIQQRSNNTTGKLGLFIDSKDGWFKNMVITPKK